MELVSNNAYFNLISLVLISYYDKHMRYWWKRIYKNQSFKRV